VPVILRLYLSDKVDDGHIMARAAPDVLAVAAAAFRP
jgi:hypothetical protein